MVKVSQEQDQESGADLAQRIWEGRAPMASMVFCGAENSKEKSGGLNIRREKSIGKKRVGREGEEDREKRKYEEKYERM
jgi:hypothetical protein